MSVNSIVKTSAECSISARVMNSGGACFCAFHHFTAGARGCKATNELSRSTQNRFRLENSGWKSPATADPNRMTLSRFVPAAARSRLTNSLIFFSGTICVLAGYQLLLAPPPPELPPPNPPNPPPPPPPPKPPPPQPPPPPRYPPPPPNIPEKSIQNKMLRSGVRRTISTTTISKTIPPSDIPRPGCSLVSAGGATS